MKHTKGEHHPDLYCPHCNKRTLGLVEANPPYSLAHVQCDNCDATYNSWSDVRKPLKKRSISRFSNER